MFQTDRLSERPGESPFGSEDRKRLGGLDDHFNAPPDQFFARLLQVALSSTNGFAGQVWGLDRAGRLSKISSTDVKRFQQFEHPDVVQQHRDTISKTLYGSHFVTLPIRELEGQVLLDRLLWLGPIQVGSRSIGVIELILPPKLEPRMLDFLNQILSVGSNYSSQRGISSADNLVPDPRAKDVQRRTTNRFDLESVLDPKKIATPLAATRSNIDPMEFESLVLLLHNQTELSYVAATTVNEIRRLLKADRVSLALRRGGRTSVVSVSGQKRVESRSDVVRAIQKIADRIVRTGQEIRSDQINDSLNSMLNDAAVEFLSTTGAAWFMCLPLFEPEKIDFDSDQHVSDQTPFATIIVEQFSRVTGENGSATTIHSALQQLSMHLSQAVFHAVDQEQIFLLPLRRQIGKIIERLKITRTRLVLGCFVAIVAAMTLTFVQVPYRVQATGRLMPVRQFRAFAPLDSEVREVWVASGQAVNAAEPLLRLYDQSLETSRLVLTNKMAEHQKLLSSYKAQMDESSNSSTQAERIALSARIVQAQIECSGLQQQIDSIEELEKRTIVRAGIAGTVATFRPNELLAGRPVSRGELLIEVMDGGGPWQLELSLPERRLGHLLNSLPGSSGDERQSADAITFAQATSPGETFRAKIDGLSTRTVNESDGSATIRLTARVAENPNLRRTIGAEVTAKIPCGERSLGYVWFGDVFDWVRQQVW